MIRRWFSKMTELLQNSLVAKINALFIIMILLFIAFSVYNTYSLSTSNKSYNNTISNYYETMELKVAAIECDRSINEYLRSGNRTNLSDFNRFSSRFRAIHANLKTALGAGETRYLLLSISDSFESYHATCCTASHRFYQKDYDYLNYMYEAQSINSYLQKYCDELLEYALLEGKNNYAGMQLRQNRLVLFNGLVIVLILLLFASSAAYISLNITKPLNQLVLAARKVSAGDFDIQVKTNNEKDTIGVLTHAFNAMTHDIKNMLSSIQEKAETEKNLLLEQQKNVQYQQMLDRANFLALQTQTNPHFMFNTLNSISRTITLGMSDEALMMIDSMVAILRYNLTNANIPVLLKQELKITEEYLKIQQYRFRNRIRGAIDCPHELAETILIPRFTLQPIVENAVIHGLEPLEKGGALKIKVRRVKDACVIKVIDNGMGMDIKKLKEENSENGTMGHTTSIGITNTRKRIQLFTEDEKSFRIISKPGLGTVAEIRIPIADFKISLTGASGERDETGTVPEAGMRALPQAGVS